jgi:uncharacterized protein (DUF2267 family)
MSQTGVRPFDSTLQTTNIWLNDIREQLRWQDRSCAYQALRAVLHALRDHLSVDRVVDLAAQLPMLVRGFYYEGWRPHEEPFEHRSKEEFLTHIASAVHDDAGTDPEQIARAVFRVLTKHVATRELERVKHHLPEELRSLWY